MISGQYMTSLKGWSLPQKLKYEAECGGKRWRNNVNFLSSTYTTKASSVVSMHSLNS